jgi:hypothetical protein
MPARWGSFAVGMGLIVAPLLLGYPEAGAILHDVAVGLLVCIASLAALDWPRARFANGLPAIWLVVVGRAADDSRIAAAELSAGALLLALALVPSARRVPRALAPPRRAGVRA